MNMKQFVLPILLLVSLPNLVQSNVTPIPAGICCFTEDQCADLVLQLAGQTPAGSLDDKKQAVHNLSKSQLVTVVLTIVDRLLNNDLSMEDNKNRVPWIGHSERLAFIFKYANIPLDAGVITTTVDTLNKYRGIASVSEFGSEKSHFRKECVTLIQDIMPQLIASSVKLLPECDTVCNPTVIAEATEILKRNSGASVNAEKLLKELQHLLPLILQNEEIKRQVEHIQSLLTEKAKNNRFIKLYNFNAAWLKSHGLKHS